MRFSKTCEKQNKYLVSEKQVLSEVLLRKCIILGMKTLKILILFLTDQCHIFKLKTFKRLEIFLNMYSDSFKIVSLK